MDDVDYKIDSQNMWCLHWCVRVLRLQEKIDGTRKDKKFLDLYCTLPQSQTIIIIKKDETLIAWLLQIRWNLTQNAYWRQASWSDSRDFVVEYMHNTYVIEMKKLILCKTYMAW